MARNQFGRSGYGPAARGARSGWRRGVALAALLALPLSLPSRSTRAEMVEPVLDVSAGGGSGIMRGGRGGLAMAQRAPVFVDVSLLTPHEPWLLVGGSLRMELEDGRAIAVVPRVALRHKMSALELRPGVGLPFYFAPKTMLGPEANVGLRLPIGSDFGLVASAGVAAFMVGNDVPKGTTVVMFHLMLGLGLLL
jgi:hypothetical protein